MWNNLIEYLFRSQTCFVPCTSNPQDTISIQLNGNLTSYFIVNFPSYNCKHSGYQELKSGRMPTFRTLPLVMCCGAVQGKSEAWPSFMPKEFNNVKDPAARLMASRIQRLPVQTHLSKEPIMSSCVMPQNKHKNNTPIVLLHSFDSSCLEWRYTYPLLEASGKETWAIDILGWGFTNREAISSFCVAAKRDHLYQFWKTYIQRPIVLVGASVGGAAAIDFAANHPESVSKLVLIDASIYSNDEKKMQRVPQFAAYAGIMLLKSIPLRLYANTLAFQNLSIADRIDSMKVGRLHCLLPKWEEATLDFMLSGGYKVGSLVKEVKKKTLVLWGENDKIIAMEFAEKMKNDLAESTLIYLRGCGHLPHVEKPELVANHILEFVGN